MGWNICMSMCTSAIKMGAHVLIFAWPNAPYAHWSCLVYIIIIANCVFLHSGRWKKWPFSTPNKPVTFLCWDHHFKNLQAVARTGYVFVIARKTKWKPSKSATGAFFYVMAKVLNFKCWIVNQFFATKTLKLELSKRITNSISHPRLLRRLRMNVKFLLWRNSFFLYYVLCQKIYKMCYTTLTFAKKTRNPKKRKLGFMNYDYI